MTDHHGTSLDWNPNNSFSNHTYNNNNSASLRTPPRTRVTPSDSKGKKKLCCDKCDGKHATEECIYFKSTRETHPDALDRPKMSITGLGGSKGNFVLKSMDCVCMTLYILPP